MKQTTKRPTPKQRREAEEFNTAMALFVAMMLILLMFASCKGGVKCY